MSRQQGTGGSYQSCLSDVSDAASAANITSDEFIRERRRRASKRRGADTHKPAISAKTESAIRFAYPGD